MTIARKALTLYLPAQNRTGNTLNESKDMNTLNKAQQREVATIEKMQHFGANYVARALSMLHRSALKNSQKAEILALATHYGVTQNSEFII